MNMLKLRKLRPVQAMITAIVLTVLLCTAAGAFTISGHVYNSFDEPVGGIMVFLTKGVAGDNAKFTTTPKLAPSTGSYEFTVDEVGTYKVWMIATSRSCYQIVDDHDNKLTPYTVKIDGDTDPAVPINIDFTAAKCVAEDTTPPAPPENLQANPLSLTEIRLSWDQSLPSNDTIDPNDTDEETVSGYRIYRDGSFLKRIYGENKTTYLDTNLSDTRDYCYTVTASDAAGNESYQSSPPRCATSQADITPPSVPTLTATAASSSRIDLFWDASEDTGSGVAGYNIYRNKVGDPSPYKTVTGTSMSDTGLSAATNYCYQVSAVDAATPGNESAQSSQQCTNTFAQSDTTPPSVPTLTATAASSSRIDLSWDASEDTGGSGVAGYNIYRNKVGDPSPYKTVTGTSMSDTGLSATTNYCYQVSAVDAATPGNESAKSSQSCATTSSSGGVCGAITNPCTIRPNAGENSFKDTLDAGQSKYYKFTIPTATEAEVVMASQDQMQLCQMFVQEGTTDNIGPGVGTNYNAALAWYEEAPEERYTQPYFNSPPRRWARMKEIVDGEIVYIEGIPPGTTYYVLIHNEDIGKATYWIAALMW